MFSEMSSFCPLLIDGKLLSGSSALESLLNGLWSNHDLSQDR